MTTNPPLLGLIHESNIIEKIPDIRVAEGQLVRYLDFLDGDLTIENVVRFAQYICPEGRLRAEVGMNVGVGRHVAPSGGPLIPIMLAAYLRDCNAEPRGSLLSLHHRMLFIHPFMDGNGRASRAILMWMARRTHSGPDSWIWDSMLRRGFLTTWYYMTLDAMDAETERARAILGDIA